MVDHVKNFGRKFEKMMEDIQKDLLFSQKNIQNLAFVKSCNTMFLSLSFTILSDPRQINFPTPDQ